MFRWIICHQLSGIEVAGRLDSDIKEGREDGMNAWVFVGPHPRRPQA